MKPFFAIISGIGLSACATSTSFAPPDIPIRHAATDTSTFYNCAPRFSQSAPRINRDVDGALALTDNFIIGYRCSMRAAADGRQPWEILSYLSLVGSTLASALGASPDVAIIGGSASSFFLGIRTYYAPQEQVEILSDAVDALLCIQTESVGISAFELQSVANAEQTALAAFRDGGVTVTVETQYFNMIASALMSVEQLTAQRLSRRGSFDAASVAAEIEQLAERVREEEEDRDDGADLPDVQGFTASQASALTSVMSVQLDLDVLRPKLDQCVTRVKV